MAFLSICLSVRLMVRDCGDWRPYIYDSSTVKVKGVYSSLQAGLPLPLWELTYHMGSDSVTCHPAELTFPPLPQPKLVLDLATPEGCKAELT